MDLDSRVSKWSAIMVLLFVLVIVYFLFFHWFFVAHAGLNDNVTSLNESRQKFVNEAAKNS